MAINIIDKSDPGIVVQETQISLSDEKIKSILLQTYERALKDSGKPTFYKHYSVFLSVAGTLFLTLMSASFSGIGNIEASTVTVVAWFICGACAILGFVLLGKSVSEKTHSHTEERDLAINEIFKSHFDSGNG